MGGFFWGSVICVIFWNFLGEIPQMRWTSYHDLSLRFSSTFFFNIKTFKLQLPQKTKYPEKYMKHVIPCFLSWETSVMLSPGITYFGCYTEVWLAYEYSKHSTDSCDVPIQFWVQVRAGLDFFFEIAMEIFPLHEIVENFHCIVC